MFLLNGNDSVAHKFREFQVKFGCFLVNCYLWKLFQIVCKLTIGWKGLISPNMSFSNVGYGSKTMCSSMVIGVEKSTKSALSFVKAMGIIDISIPSKRISDEFPAVLFLAPGIMWLSKPLKVPLGDTLRISVSFSKRKL